MDLFCFVWFMFVFVMLSCLFLAALLPPAGEELTSWPSKMLCCLVCLSFSHKVFWSDVVHDSVDY